MRAVAEATVDDGDRADLCGEAHGFGAAEEDLPVATDRVRSVGVGVRIPPRPLLAGDRELLLDRLVIGQQVGVGDRPVGPHPVLGERGEVAGVEARRVARVVNHRAADPSTGVVRTQRDRVGAGDDSRFGPVEVVGAGFVADPVGVGVPERPGVQHDDSPAGPGQSLGHRRAAGTAPDDNQVDLVGVLEAAHVLAQLVVDPLAVSRQQPCGLVAIAHRTHDVPRSGSSDGFASWTSNGSSLSTPAFLYPRG